MAERLRLSSTEGGGNWWRTINWAADGFRAAGFDVELTRFGPHGDNTCRRVAQGISDVCVTLASFAWMAAKGRQGFGPEDAKVRGLALCVHPRHCYYFTLARDTGITSFADIAAKKPPLRLCISGDPTDRKITGAVLAAHGVDLMKDIEAWGGNFFYEFAEAGRLVLTGEADGIMRENTRIGPVGEAAAGRDMVFLSLEPDLAKHIAAEFGTPVLTLPAGTVRGMDQPVTTVESGGYPLICGADLDDDLVYRMAKAINESFPVHYASEDIFYSPKHAPNTGAPLHPGAARYYREIGVLADGG